MPQLMPLYWMISTFMLLLLVLYLIDVYFMMMFNKVSDILNLNKMVESNWCW